MSVLSVFLSSCFNLCRQARRGRRGGYAGHAPELLESRALLAFTAGNIAVYRVGTGTGALTSAATAAFIDEYSPSGTLVSSTPMPTAVDGFNRRLTNSGTATSEGALSLSTDGRYLTVAGYDAATGTASVASTATTTGATVERVVAAVDVDQVVNTRTRTTSFSGNNIRGAVMSSSGGMWLTGGNSGLIFLPLEANGTGTAVASTPANLRVPAIFGGQLYVSSGSTGVRIGSVGTGTPTGGGNSITSLPGYSTSTGSPYAFYLADLSSAVAGPDTLYVADDTPGTLQKYSLSGGSWVARGTVTLSGCRGVTGVVSGSTVTLYATSGTSLVRVTDSTGYDGNLTATATTLVTASSNTVFRGVALVPTRLPSITSLTPADDSTGVSTAADLRAIFNKNVFAASGTILIRKVSDNSTAFSLDVAGPDVSITGSIVTINPPTDLEAGTAYYVQIPSTALRDEFGNLFAGISDANTWNFSTLAAGDSTPPAITSLSPADDSSSASISADLVITFNETIMKGTGNILVKRSSDDSTVHSIDVTSAAVTVAGSTASINPPADLQNLTGYYVQIPATAFRDASSNFFAGILDKTTWNFTTVPDSTPPSVLSIDDGDADNSVTAGTLLSYTLTFSEDIDSTTVSSADFDNEGTSAVTFGTITETAPGVFTVKVTPTTGGTLKLRIPSTANISDTAGNALVVPVSDNDTISVSGDTTPPTVVSIVDDRSGTAINANLPIVYTITFDEDINAASVSAADFTNAGTANIQIGTITEPSPGVFSVTVTPRSSGSLQLRIPVGADITDISGNQLAPPVTDDTTITVNSVTTLTAGDIAFTGLQSDDPDTFSFVLLKDVINGTQIVFTDNLWNGSTLATNENTLTLTLNSSGSGFPAGTHFVNTNGGTAPAFRVVGTTTSAGLVTGSLSGLSTSGDSILAWQGVTPTSGNSAAWIAGINSKAWWTAATDPTGNNESRLPAALTLGTTAIQLSSTATEVDNGAFNLTPNSFTGTARAARSAVNNFANWTTSNSLGPVSTTTFSIQPNQAPTDISLSNSSVAENLPTGITVGTLSATDPNTDESFTFSLPAGPADNVFFSVAGNSLRTAASFNFEARSSYQVTVRVADVEGLTFDKQLTISITDVLTESTGIDVQSGQTQRSYVRYLDLLFSTGSELAALIGGNRFQLTKNDLNGVNPVNVPLTAGMFSTIGNRARIDFGVNGLGGNRNTSGGDGYYEIAMDLDSNGTFETKKYFYRLLGDVNGDRKVDSSDASLIGSSMGTNNPERDANGDGVVNATDRTLSIRAALRKLKDGLLTDD
ncbi:MAG: beta strand repeat-containing protein [Planctomyces sp.]